MSELIDTGVGVMNLSFGSAVPCVTLYTAVEQAIGAGILVTAAAGNEFDLGNPVIYPAAFPHVIGVASVGLDLRPSYFSSATRPWISLLLGSRFPWRFPSSSTMTMGCRTA